MAEDLDAILRRVAAGELTPDEAEPLVAAATVPAARSTPRAEPLRRVTLRVMEGGRPVVHLRLPTAWASLAGSVLPGLSGSHAERIREALRAGEVGPILDIRDEDGDGVIISTE